MAGGGERRDPSLERKARFMEESGNRADRRDES